MENKEFWTEFHKLAIGHPKYKDKHSRSLRQTENTTTAKKLKELKKVRTYYKQRMLKLRKSYLELDVRITSLNFLINNIEANIYFNNNKK